MEIYKPCPFCGGRKMKLTVKEMNVYSRGAYVRCTQCNARGPLVSADYRNGEEVVRGLAEELWNRRVYDV